MPAPDTIITRRLHGRRATSDDLPLLLVTDEEWEVQRSLFGVLPTRAETEMRLQRWVAMWDEQGYGFYFFFDRDEAYVGHGGVFASYSKPGEIELGYVVLPAHWGRGYATEIAAASLEMAFEALAATHVVAHTAPENTASRRVLEKIGFVENGTSIVRETLPSIDYVARRPAAV